MDVDEMLKRVRLDLPKLAKLSGISLAYLKHLSAGNRAAGDETRRQLATALRAHARQLEADADTLDPPPEGASLSEQAF